MDNKTIRESTEADYASIVDYFKSASPDFLLGMGADHSKLPQKEEWLKFLLEEHKKDYEDKKYYYLAWVLDGKAIGHTNINHIVYGNEATMHLHVWNVNVRQKGLGLYFLKESIPVFFEVFELKKIICEPYAYNPAPNKILPKVGFKFIEQYETIPGPINLKQEVRRYEITRSKLGL